MNVLVGREVEATDVDVNRVVQDVAGKLLLQKTRFRESNFAKQHVVTDPQQPHHEKTTTTAVSQHSKFSPTQQPHREETTIDTVPATSQPHTNSSGDNIYRRRRRGGRRPGQGSRGESGEEREGGGEGRPG